MNGNRARWIKAVAGCLSLAALWALEPRPTLWADDDADEQKLIQEAIKIDEIPAVPEHEQDRIRALAQKFGVSESELSKMRSRQNGWGEIALSLSFARELASTSKAPMTVQEGLEQIELMRGRRMEWHQISTQLRLELGPVLREARGLEKLLKDAESSEKGKVFIPYTQ